MPLVPPLLQSHCLTRRYGPGPLTVARLYCRGVVVQHVVAVNPTSEYAEQAPILCILSTTKMHTSIKPDLSLFSGKWANGRQPHCAKWNFTSLFILFSIPLVLTNQETSCILHGIGNDGVSFIFNSMIFVCNSFHSLFLYKHVSLPSVRSLGTSQNETV